MMAEPEPLAFTKYARVAMADHDLPPERILQLTQCPDRVAAGADGALNLYGRIDGKDVRVSLDVYAAIPLVIRVSVLGVC